MKCIFFIIILTFCYLEICAQPFLEFIQKEINLDTVPQRIIDGQKRMVLNVKFRNVGNKPLIVEELSTVVTDYSLKYEYKYKPAKPIPPQDLDSIVVIILPESDAKPLYYYNPNVWEIQIYSNSSPNYFNSMKCIWNSCQSIIIPLSDLGSKHDQLIEGTNYLFNYLLLTQGEIPVTIDSIIFEVKDKRNHKRIKYNSGFPIIQKKNDTMNIHAFINTTGQYGEVRCESYVFYHYPNLQSAKFNTSDDYEVLPNIKVIDSSNRYFGTINQGEEVRADFSFKNNGTYTLYLRNSDCVSFTQDIVYAGEIAAIRINYDSKFDTGKVHKSYRIWFGRNKKDSCCKWESNLKYFDLVINGVILQQSVNIKNEFLRLADTVLSLGDLSWKEIQKRNHFPDEYIMITDSIQYQNISSFEIISLDVKHPLKKVAAGWSDKRKAKPGEQGKIYFQTMINKGENEFNDIFYVKFEVQYGCQTKRFDIPIRIHGEFQK